MGSRIRLLLMDKYGQKTVGALLALSEVTQMERDLARRYTTERN